MRREGSRIFAGWIPSDSTRSTPPRSESPKHSEAFLAGVRHLAQLNREVARGMTQRAQKADRDSEVGASKKAAMGLHLPSRKGIWGPRRAATCRMHAPGGDLEVLDARWQGRAVRNLGVAGIWQRTQRGRKTNARQERCKAGKQAKGGGETTNSSERHAAPHHLTMTDQLHKRVRTTDPGDAAGG